MVDLGTKVIAKLLARAVLGAPELMFLQYESFLMPAGIPALCGKLQSAGEGVWSHPPEGKGLSFGPPSISLNKI